MFKWCQRSALQVGGPLMEEEAGIISDKIHKDNPKPFPTLALV